MTLCFHIGNGVNKYTGHWQIIQRDSPAGAGGGTEVCCCQLLIALLICCGFLCIFC